MLQQNRIITILFSFLLSMGYPDALYADPSTEFTSPSYVVLELFTSEGCSSCPPADDLLRQLSTYNQNIYVLSFHVDYWNRLGWNDPFSSEVFTNRQRAYSRDLKTGVFTPQLIVNGNKSIVGSRRKEVLANVASSLKQQSNCRLELTILKNTNSEKNNTSLKLKYHFERANKQDVSTKEHQLVIALTQDNAKVEVTRGENANRTLSHVHVVRSLKTLNMQNQSGTFSIDVPTELRDQEFMLLGFIQDNTTRKILVADRCKPE